MINKGIELLNALNNMKNVFIKDKVWNASWIWTDKNNKIANLTEFRYNIFIYGDIREYEGFLRISADSRYQIFVNEQFISRGPARSDLQHYIYETYNITDALSPGENIICVEVLFFGNNGPLGEMHDRPGLIIDGGVFDKEGNVVYEIKTDNTWKAKEDISYKINRDINSDILYAIGFGEIVDGRKRDDKWIEPDFDDSDWTLCRKTESPWFVEKGLNPSSRKWLYPKDIPNLEEVYQRFKGIIKSTKKVDTDFNVYVKPYEECCFILDTGRLTTGYPRLQVEGGKNRKIKVTYAEALWVGDKKIRNTNDLPESADLCGYYDMYICSGKRSLYQPFLLRTFRFIKVEIFPGKEPLRLININYIFSAYPFKKEAEFESSDPDCHKLFDISFWTARLCAHEHYEDCPYYERLQYAGDTRIQALISYCMTGDNKLAKRAIKMFDFSRIPEGLTQSRYPSNHMQIIPPFSLFWIMMIEDYVMYTGDIELCSGLRSGILSVLNWFEGQMKNGLVANLPYWNFVDWCPEWKDGVPPSSKEGISSIINLQFVAALQSAVRISRICNMDDDSRNPLELSLRLQQNIKNKCFSVKDNVYLDAPGKPFRSQHANIWAILTDTASSNEQHKIADMILSDKNMSQTTYYHSFYLFRAFSKLNKYHKVYPFLNRWRDLIKEGFTTWPESPGETRSDCHAWSAWVCFDFMTEILGIKPKTPGLKDVYIRPSICNLSFAKGRFPYHGDYIHVEWHIKDKTFIISGDIPQDCKAEIITPSQKTFEDVKGRFEIEDKHVMKMED